MGTFQFLITSANVAKGVFLRRHAVTMGCEKHLVRSRFVTFQQVLLLKK